MSWPNRGGFTQMPITTNGTGPGTAAGDILTIKLPKGFETSTYSWTIDRGAGPVSLGVTTATYQVQPADIPPIGSEWPIVGRAGPNLNLISRTFEVVNPPIAPAVVSPPSINGTPTQGVAVTATAAVFSGIPTPTVVRSWLVDGVVVATGVSTYTPFAGDVGKQITVREVATNSGGVASSDSLPLTVAAGAATLRQVATGTFINDTQHPSNKQANIRSPHYLRDSVAQMRIVLPNWFVTSQVETNGSGADTWSASIEYPAGTFTRVTFGGNNTGTASVGNNLISDLVTAPPKDVKFWVRLFLNSAGLIKFFQYYAGDGTAQAEFGVSGLTDKTMGGAMATVASSNTGFIMPCAIIGVSAMPAVADVGDSISVGRGDSDGVGRALQGHLGRAYGAVYPNGHVGVSGDRIQAYLLSNSKRTALVNNYFTHVAFNMGINDVSAGRTAPQVEADTNSMLNLFPGKPKAVCTLGPVSTSTDGWVTVVNQTASVATSNAVRSAVNTQRLTTLPLAKIVHDVNPVIENQTSPEDSLFNITGGANTNDGTHFNANSNGRVAASIDPNLLVAP